MAQTAPPTEPKR